ncbi:Hypothetical predicted protein [Podarcis lilfordi]|uniref:Uncharacterized protein n=1 Tax=Podarcis lilfordi TaxID=74358 RepID=A0AA35K6R8_9SAUR|nr:Hypothetical predicted protein [Podarcis lilfordi]
MPFVSAPGWKRAGEVLACFTPSNCCFLKWRSDNQGKRAQGNPSLPKNPVSFQMKQNYSGG